MCSLWFKTCGLKLVCVCHRPLCEQAGCLYYTVIYHMILSYIISTRIIYNCIDLSLYVCIHIHIYIYIYIGQTLYTIYIYIYICRYVILYMDRPFVPSPPTAPPGFRKSTVGSHPQLRFIHIHQLFRIYYTCFKLDTVNIHWWICLNVCLVSHAFNSLNVKLRVSNPGPLLICTSTPLAPSSPIAITLHLYGQYTFRRQARGVPIYLSIYISIYLSIYISTSLSLSICVYT